MNACSLYLKCNNPPKCLFDYITKSEKTNHISSDERKHLKRLRPRLMLSENLTKIAQIYSMPTLEELLFKCNHAVNSYRLPPTSHLPGSISPVSRDLDTIHRNTPPISKLSNSGHQYVHYFCARIWKTDSGNKSEEFIFSVLFTQMFNASHYCHWFVRTDPLQSHRTKKIFNVHWWRQWHTSLDMNKGELVQNDSL